MNNLFDQATPGNNIEQPAQPQPTNQEDTVATLLSGIRNESGEIKYRSVDEALKGLAHAQQYISTLKAEKQALETQFSEARTKLKSQEELERIVNDATSRQKTVDTPAPTFDESKLAEIVDKQIGSRKNQELIQSNQKSVSDALLAQFGEKATEVLQGKATELGISIDDIAVLAGRSPKAVLTMFGAVSGAGVHKQPTAAPSSSSINTAGFTRAGGELTYNRDDFTLRPGATGSDYQDLVDRSSQLLKQLEEQNGVGIYDLQNPSVFFKHFR